MGEQVGKESTVGEEQDRDGGAGLAKPLGEWTAAGVMLSEVMRR
ncbi:hypothetical protein [Pseudarthrobacter sp. BIM B-2242]|nr:hypothetical protein [Pseudarthrobacter sp. BIM B-2242]